ncbi:MAG: class I SAM-dependent methyltransferase [Pseudomonadota bacterium]|nr:class I SAM-dependent methyltransferase [Pseudomonadota bacterium]
MNHAVSSFQTALGYRAFEDTAEAGPLTERTHPGLHAEILQHLLAYVVTRGSVLDLGCGTGAWLARLQHHGFRRVLGADCDAEAFGLDGTDHVALDLDGRFSQDIARSFDVITAIEVIEHVESPAGFLREARKLINPGGVMLVTTPNVECIQGRLRFLLQGKLRNFEDDNNADPTRISPQLSSLMPRLATRAGWKIDQRIELLKHASRPAVKFVCGVLSPFLDGSAKDGDIHLFVLRPI